jgi:hypothetical protein
MFTLRKKPPWIVEPIFATLMGSSEDFLFQNQFLRPEKP